MVNGRVSVCNSYSKYENGSVVAIIGTDFLESRGGKSSASQGCRLSTRRPCAILLGLIFIDSTLNTDEIPPGLASLTLKLPDSISFGLGVAMRSEDYLENNFDDHIESIVEETQVDPHAKFVKEYMKVVLSNSNHLRNFNRRNVPQGHDYSPETQFLHKPEVGLMEGVMWQQLSEEYVDGLIVKLKKIFNGTDYNAQVWRQRFFASMTSLTIEHTYSGNTLMTHNFWKNSERYAEDTADGDGTPEKGELGDFYIYSGQPYVPNHLTMNVLVYPHSAGG